MAERKEAGVGNGSRAFQPGQEPVTADWSAASKGVGVNQAGAALVGGISDVTDMAIKGSIQYINQDIEDQVRENDDALKNINMGYSDEIARRAKSTEELTDAYRANAISPTYYWMQMDQASRSLRAQYPNFRNEIDKAFSKITGGVPANELMSQLQKKAASKRLTEEERMDRVLTEQTLKDPPPGYFANPQSWTRERLFAYFAGRNEYKANQERIEAEWKNKEAENKNTAATQEDSFNRMTDNKLNAAQEAQSTIFGADWPTQFANAQKLAAMKPGDRSPEDVMSTTAYLNGVADKAKRDAETDMARLGGRIDAGKRRQILDNVNKRIDSIFAPWLDKDHGLQAQLITFNAYTSANAQAKLNEIPNRAMLVENMKQLGPQLSAEYILRNPKEIDAQVKGIADLGFAQSITKGTPLSETLTGTIDGQKMTPQAMNMTIDNLVWVATNPNADPKSKSNAIKALYTNPEPLLAQLRKADDGSLQKYTQAVMSRQMAETMKQVKASGDETTWKAWKDASEQAWISNHRAAVQTVQGLNTGGEFVDVHYDPVMIRFTVAPAEARTNRFDIPNAEVGGGFSIGFGHVAKALQTNYEARAKVAADQLNEGMRVLANLWHSGGADDQAIRDNIQKTLQIMGYNEAVRNEGSGIGSFFSKLTQAVQGTQREDATPSRAFDSVFRNLLAPEYRPGPSEEVTQEKIDEARRKNMRINLDDAFGPEMGRRVLESGLEEARRTGPFGDSGSKSKDGATENKSGGTEEQGDLASFSLAEEALGKVFDIAKYKQIEDAPNPDAIPGKTSTSPLQDISLDDAQVIREAKPQQNPGVSPEEVTQMDSQEAERVRFRSVRTEDIGRAITTGDTDEIATMIRTSEFAPLLELIAKHESGRWGYNAAHSGSAPVDLENLTINEVINLQQQLLRSGKESTAIGKYQMLDDTLRDNARWAGIDPATAKFTAANQELLNLARLKKFRGLDDYMDGKISKEQFARNLAKEYASMPLSNGQSYYKGKGSNRALVGYKTFLDAIPDSNPTKEAKKIMSSGKMNVIERDLSEKFMGDSGDKQLPGLDNLLKAISTSERQSPIRLIREINRAVIDDESFNNSAERDAYYREMAGDFVGIYNLKREFIADTLLKSSEPGSNMYEVAKQIKDQVEFARINQYGVPDISQGGSKSIPNFTGRNA